MWLEVLAEAGADVAARKLAEMDAGIVTAGFAQHLRVYDRAAVSRYTTTDGLEITEAVSRTDGLVCEVGGYLAVARRTDSWEAIVAVLTSLAEDHHDCFEQVMSGCRALSNSGFEIDGLDDLLDSGDQAMFDVAVDREQRRETRGYVAPAQARAFLEASRRLRFGPDTVPPVDPIARAHLRTVDPPAATDAHGAREQLPEGTRTLPFQTITPNRSRPLSKCCAMQASSRRSLAHYSMRRTRTLRACNTSRRRCSSCSSATTSSLRRGMTRSPFSPTRSRRVARCRHAHFRQRKRGMPQRLSAISGSRTGRRTGSPRRSVSAVAHTGTALPDDFLLSHDLVTVFQVGWTVLHDNVVMHVAEQVIDILATLRCDDGEIQSGLDALRIELTKHWRAGAPWRAGDALDVITTLDMPAWAALAGLLNECPVMHAGLSARRGSGTHAVSATDFEFISENSQIASVREFLRLLPSVLFG